MLNDACRQAGLTSISFWANVPALYFRGAQSQSGPGPGQPSRVLSSHIALDTTELVTGAAEFDAQVTKAIADNPNLAAYVKRLEEQEQEEGLETETAEQGKTGNGNGHANGKDMAEETPAFLAAA